MRIVLASDYYQLADQVRARIPQAAVVVVDRSELPVVLPGTDAVVTDRLTREDTAGADRLRLVHAYSAGADRIDRAALPPGCVLCNLHGPENAIAEWTLGAMVALSRRFLPFDRALREGLWQREEDPAREVRGRTVATIGYGHIGRRVAELSHAIGMDAIAVTRSPAPDRAGGVRWLGGLDEVERLLKEADFAVVAVPAEAETRGLVGERELTALGPEGYLVNVARGEIVDEQALYESLRDGRIAGAAIDTWYRYPAGSPDPTPPSRFPFHELDNVLMSPHLSGTTEETDRNRVRILVEQLERFARGEALENVIAVG